VAYPAVGIVEELLVEWFSAIATWSPASATSHDGCTSCSDSPIALALGITEWPHDLVHLIVTRAGTMTEVLDEQLMLRILEANARDAHDIYESCVAQQLQSYLRTEVEWLIANAQVSR
jgi:hypothetical protein